jgi:hypothetical protein
LEACLGSVALGCRNVPKSDVPPNPHLGAGLEACLGSVAFVCRNVPEPGAFPAGAAPPLFGDTAVAVLLGEGGEGGRRKGGVGGKAVVVLPGGVGGGGWGGHPPETLQIWAHFCIQAPLISCPKRASKPALRVQVWRHVGDQQG